MLPDDCSRVTAQSPPQSGFALLLPIGTGFSKAIRWAPICRTSYLWVSLAAFPSADHFLLYTLLGFCCSSLSFPILRALHGWLPICSPLKSAVCGSLSSAALSSHCTCLVCVISLIPTVSSLTEEDDHQTCTFKPCFSLAYLTYISRSLQFTFLGFSKCPQSCVNSTHLKRTDNPPICLSPVPSPVRWFRILHEFSILSSCISWDYISWNNLQNHWPSLVHSNSYSPSPIPLNSNNTKKQCQQNQTIILICLKYVLIYRALIYWHLDQPHRKVVEGGWVGYRSFPMKWSSK